MKTVSAFAKGIIVVVLNTIYVGVRYHHPPLALTGRCAIIPAKAMVDVQQTGDITVGLGAVAHA